jgi:hypothetical protein
MPLERTGALLIEVDPIPFTELTDVPTSYALQGGKVVKVNALETGLEFVAMLAQNAPLVLSTVTAVNLKTIAVTNLYTVPTGKKCVVTALAIRVVTATSVTVAPQLGAGITAGEADIISLTTLTGLNAVGQIFVINTAGLFVTGAAASVIKLGVDVGATATALTADIDLIGYLV